MAHFFPGRYMLLFAVSIYQIFNGPIEHVDTRDPTLAPSLPGNHLRFARRWASDIVFSRTVATAAQSRSRSEHVGPEALPYCAEFHSAASGVRVTAARCSVLPFKNRT
jgi:hypothetical protein